MDPVVVSWVQAMVASRGANCSVLWIDEIMKKHEWRVPPILKGAITNADLFINFSLDLAIEEDAEFRQYIEETKTWYVRMFPVTTALLMTDWARTPHELVVMVRHVSSDPFMNHMAKFVMSDPNGTELEGNILDPVKREGIPGMPYNSWRRDASHYIPWPEWVHPPVNCKDVNGVLFFDCMLPYWSRYMGIAPAWKEPVRVDVKDNKMVKISGGKEADAINRALKDLETKVGDGIWKFDTFHFGIHPNASVTHDQCPNDIYRRIIEHSHPSNMHWHLGSAPANENYNYYPHITADIRNCHPQDRRQARVGQRLHAVPAGPESARGRCQVPRPSRRPRRDLGQQENRYEQADRLHRAQPRRRVQGRRHRHPRDQRGRQQHHAARQAACEDMPKRAGYLAYAPKAGVLYSVDERKTDGRGPKKPASSVMAFKVDQETGALTFLNQQPTVGAMPASITRGRGQGAPLDRQPRLLRSRGQGGRDSPTASGSRSSSTTTRRWSSTAWATTAPSARSRTCTC